MLSVEKTMLFLLSRAGQMEVHQFLTIYEQRGYTPSYIRNSLSRLKREGYITSPARSVYQITDEGRVYLASVNRKPGRYLETWDHSWHIVMTQVPELERKKRDQFRTSLLQWGFGHLYNSVYVSPWDYRQEVHGLIQSLGLEGNVSLLEGHFIEGGITSAQAAEIWSLADVAALYRDKQQWCREGFAPHMKAALQRGEALELFLLHLQLGESMSELMMADPSLPSELLPPDWPGKAIIQELAEYRQQLADHIPRDSFYAVFT